MTRKIFGHTCVLVFLFVISQNIPTSGALVDNFEEASSQISVLESLIDENGVIHDLGESVLKANGQCKQDSDCYHSGKCVTKKNAIKECECKNGTSGPLCKVVDECVAKSSKCGSGKDVQCVFDVVSEKAVCKCDDSSKKFDTITKTCRVPCELYSSVCGDYGTCRRDYASNNTFAFCSCRNGVRGDRCETIDKCVNKEVDCGADPTVTCTLNVYDEVYCKCKQSKQAFDDTEKVCKDCECGEGSTQCSFKKGKKTCDCRNLYFFNGEKCEDCKCGTGSISCSMVDGKKICDCVEYFEQRFDQCALCDCWKNGENCTFNTAGEKQCDCYPGYAMSKGGICAAYCNSTHRCRNGGTCNKVCQCPKGTSGDFCEKVDWCDYNMCGFYDDVECLYNKTSGEGYCNCKKDKHYYEEVTRRCYECNCGDYGECILAYDAKVCICQEGYSDYILKCKRCDCGYASFNCSFKSLGGKLCQCKEGYAQKTRIRNYEEEDATCAPCDCGEHGKCRYDNEELMCECEENYKVFQGKCKECFCGYDGYCDFNSNGEKTCFCDKGFINPNGVCVPCNCDHSSLGDMKFGCHFVDGVKQCDCPDGFKATVDFCEDIDECLNVSACPHNTVCKNLPGNYSCECKPGFQVKKEGLNPRDVECEDINECENNGTTCISDACVCINSPGSYDCVCKDGYYMAAASSGEHYNPTYNQCYAKKYTLRKTGIIIGVILAVGIISVTGYILYKKHWSSLNRNSGLELR